MLSFGICGLQLLSVLIVINGITSSSSQSKCNPNEFEECTNLMKPVMDNPSVAYPENEVQIMETCRYLRDYLRCLNNFASRCYESPVKAEFLKGFSGFQSVTDELCTPGSSLRRDTLKHSPCYKTVHPELQQCAKISEEQSTRMQKKFKDDVPDKEKIMAACCALKATKHCTMTPISKKCGKEAADLGMQTWDRLVGQPLSGLCSSVEHDSPQCSAGSVITIPSVFSFALMLIAVVSHLAFLHL